MILFSGIISIHSETCYEYGDKSSCYDTTIATDDSMECYGYESCYSSWLITTSSIDCDGFKACKNHKGLIANGGSITCGGKYGMFIIHLYPIQ